MPVAARLRMKSTLLCLAVPLLLTACGGPDKGGNSASISLKGLETADGTINDSMTDLDGVQSDAPAAVSSKPTAAEANADEAKADDSAAPRNDSESQSEVVADQ